MRGSYKKMEYDDSITLSALKFVCGDNEHICRLCFAATKSREISVEDSVRIQKPYYDETVTFLTMFQDLGVQVEPNLPQVLCKTCATITINSFSFQKLCKYSDKKWNEILDQLTSSMRECDKINANIQSIYFVINKKDSLIFTSRTKYLVRSKKIAITKLKSLIKGRKNNIKFKKGIIDLICEECGEQFVSKLLLLKHMRFHTKFQNPCTKCPKVFSTPLQLKEHVERVHYPKRIKCSKCPKMFSTGKMLKIHDRVYHTAALCKQCSIEFPSRKALRAHMNKHQACKCARCHKKFINKNAFKYHIKSCGTIKDTQPKFFCDICNKGYVHKNGLRTHLKTDHGFGEVLACEWCGKKFDAISRLKYHIVKHTRERNFHCDQCGGKFVTLAALIYHIRLHTGERPFSCDMCNESFLSASRRMEHKRRKHFGPTQECHMCQVKFVTKHQLRKHVQRHYNPHSKLYIPDVKKSENISLVPSEQ